MLTSIYIENIALIRRLSIETASGFCAFTGETGAGKSIIVDSLGLLCGARSDKDIIRSGEDDALVEGIFFVNDKKTLSALKELDIEPEEDGNITVTRRLSRDGRSVAKINGRNVPLSRLRAAAEELVSIHGQQDTQSLSDPAKQLLLLDAFSHSEAELADYSAKYKKYKETEKELDDLTRGEDEKAMRLDMLKYRINELKSADIRPGEKDDLESERKILANREKILSRAGHCYGEIYSKDGSATESVESAIGAINSLKGIIPEAEDVSARLENIKYELIDIADTLKSSLDDDGENPESKLDDIESRLTLIKRLETKYKLPADDFADALADWEAEAEKFENSAFEIEKLKKSLAVALKDAESSAEVLSNKRRSAAKTLSVRVKDELTAVDMPNVDFAIDFTKKDLSANGSDDICFMISANRGEVAKPMSKIASGGELSRIMLCLKCVFADSESIGTLIFDEIDTGVSGSTSEKIGIRLKRASDGGKTQVICVTHSAVLAARAHAHYKISKKVIGDRTETSVELLDKPGRVSEIARILGGVDVSETVIAAAEEMIDRGEKE